MNNKVADQPAHPHSLISIFVIRLMESIILANILFVFVALRPMSTAMVIAGRSFQLTTLFLGRLEQAVNQ